MKARIFIIVLFCVSVVNAQTKSVIYDFDLAVDNQKCMSCDIDAQTELLYSVQTKDIGLKGVYDLSYVVKSITYENVLTPSKLLQKEFSESSNLNVNFGKSGVDNYLTVFVNPFIRVSGVLKMIKSIEFEINYQSFQLSQNRAASFANESVLKAGTWYKFSANRTGVYKLDKSVLESAGINTATLNPQHVNIYANQIPVLPFYNDAFHPDDLVKNPILIQGEGDGSFDANDFILCYVNGPDYETLDTGVGFKLSKNNNDSLAYFYLEINSNSSPKRIQSIANSTSGVTHTVNSFNAAVLHEINDVNLISSGTNWLGESFDVELSHSFGMSVPGVITSQPIKIKTSVASENPIGSSYFNIRVNGGLVDVLNSFTDTDAHNKGKNVVNETTFNTSTSQLDFLIEFSRTSPSTLGWLNRVTLNYRRSTSLSSGQFLCRDWVSVGSGNVSSFSVSNASSSSFIWDVTDPRNTKNINGNLSGTTLAFTQNTDTLRSFAVFNSSQAYTPVFYKTIANQNLHGLPQVDYIIVSHAKFLSQANRLADLHRNKGLSVHVVEIQQVYNEFSCGVADPVAIRWLTKMFYDRSVSDPGTAPQSLLLFGDGSYDGLNRETENTALLPTYRSLDVESNNSPISFESSFTSDDFFGMLDDLESMGASDLLDVGIGRFPVNTLEEATNVVNKVEHYMNYGSNLFSEVSCNSDGTNSTFGDWRGRSLLIADDQNGGQFVYDCETLSDLVEGEHNEINILKLYLDAYQQVVTSGGQRYPDVEDALDQYISQGMLTVNYVGHGGETGLSLERIVTIPMIQEWRNINRLPLFISATCEFSRFDDPYRTSAGEVMLLTPNGGAVALLTTTRLVYISLNSLLVRNLYQNLFDEINGKPLSMGEIIKLTKNLTAGNNNMRNFTLLGDPALLLGKPRPTIVTDSINGQFITTAIDTMKALSKITINGHIEDYLGNELPNYNGIVSPTVYDKYKIRTTLGQDSDSPITDFDIQNNIIYKGKSTVKNGKFEFTFIVPKDINYEYGKSKVSYYAQNGVGDKLGFDTSVVIGGVDPNGLEDNIGPGINLFMNDENFANGGLTDVNPLFIANINDENGINTSGNGIGHDITAIIDENTADPIIMNNYYEADLDTYKSGKVQFQFVNLEEGRHTLKFKVWDVNNNSSEEEMEFIVRNKEEIAISHLLNYPNPFTTHTEFYFEHNQIHNITEAKIEIMTVTGKLVRTIYSNVESCAYRSEGIPWDGLDEYGDKLARGVYVYRLSIKNTEGKTDQKLEKLYIL
jgi:hypothetical protein